MFFYPERAVHVSVDCYDPVRSWHLELEVCVMWHCIEFCKCCPPEQCMIATAKRDDVED